MAKINPLNAMPMVHSLSSLSNHPKTQKILWFLICLFPAIFHITGRSYRHLYTVIIVMGILYLYNSLPLVVKQKDLRLIIYSFGFYFLIFLLNMLYYHGDLNELHKVKKFIYALPILLMLACMNIHLINHKLKYYCLAIYVGGIISGIIAIYQTYVLHVDRAFTPAKNTWTEGYHSIQSGDISMTLAVMSLIAGWYFLKQRNYRYAILGLIAFIAGVTASLLSQSRGGWIVLPLVFLYILYISIRHLSWKALFFLLPAIIAGAIVFSDYPQVEKRIEATKSDILKYQQGQSSTSLGIRFELWESAWHTIKIHPVIGAGYQDRLKYRNHWGELGFINPEVSLWKTHSHNQYIEALEVRGVIGLISLLMIFLVPLAIFYRNKCNNASLKTQLTADLGITLILSFMIFSLSQAIFSHNSGAVFYTVMICTLLGININQSIHKEEQ